MEGISESVERGRVARSLDFAPIKLIEHRPILSVPSFEREIFCLGSVRLCFVDGQASNYGFPVSISGHFQSIFFCALQVMVVSDLDFFGQEVCK
ncbi:MAG: hypothetical protein CL917_18510 [Deltaproteobacteria bacterium]|nr:hypothetical protein [Deltaproteobacteria bacterium]